jgi:hypothetical protein
LERGGNVVADQQTGLYREGQAGLEFLQVAAGFDPVALGERIRERLVFLGGRRTTGQFGPPNHMRQEELGLMLGGQRRRERDDALSALGAIQRGQDPPIAKAR